MAQTCHHFVGGDPYRFRESPYKYIHLYRSNTSQAKHRHHKYYNKKHNFEKGKHTNTCSRPNDVMSLGSLGMLLGRQFAMRLQVQFQIPDNYRGGGGGYANITQTTIFRNLPQIRITT